MEQLLEQFDELSVAVVGDLILDRYVWGDVSRISPEAPVPVVRVDRKNDRLGGAGNTAQVIQSLGAAVEVFGRLGEDVEAGRFEELLAEKNIGCQTLPNHRDFPTTVKTRVIASGQHVVRIDEEKRTPVEADKLEAIAADINEALEGFDALLLSDYGKGVFSPETLPIWRRISNRLDLPVVVDPYTEHFNCYNEATILTPNETEFRAGMKIRESEDHDLDQLARKALDELGLEALLVTRGEAGMTLFQPGESSLHLETEAREVYDVTGAGDTVAGVVALGEALGANRGEVIRLANKAAGLVVGRMGTAAVERDELEEALEG